MGSTTLRRFLLSSTSTPFACSSLSSSLFTTFGFVSCIADLIVLMKKIEGSLIILTIYVDDIFVTESDEADISAIKAYLQRHLNIHDLKTLSLEGRSMSPRLHQTIFEK
ncbi:unnamed protein product [Spirodela intermedia]|uniref:Uncharacterized protein n=2 Tax=Spirodela intermedia TaxID=51605 RepID=A0A7I8KMK7_SPIIN|nr:unnamed protein product [Spirodela intermedia]CAA6662620.1 unnamed protein product [Spirodela intermedia]CAA7399027.1 unnamed protein product [Spirodela intermedia]